MANSNLKQALEDSELPGPSNFIIYLAALFCAISSKAQSFTVRDFHTTQAHSMHSLTILLYATSLANVEHPNMVLRKIFKILEAFEAVNLQWSDHVNV